MTDAPKPVSEMTVLELIERFEKDIIYDAHSFRAKYHRSDARKELVKRRLGTVDAIVDHLWEGKGYRTPELKTAWTLLVTHIVDAIV